MTDRTPIAGLSRLVVVLFFPFFALGVVVQCIASEFWRGRFWMRDKIG